MLIKAKTLKGYKLNSLDGEIGKVEEFYFDDHYWTIRYLIAQTRGWLTGWQVLISPYELTTINKEDGNISINLTKKKIEESPLLETDKPVSQQYEESVYSYYGHPIYWGGASIWGSSPYIENGMNLGMTAGYPTNVINKEKSVVDNNSWNPHLQSTDVVRGYTIHGTDGDIGHIDDFVIDDKNWAIRYLIVGTKNWWPGKKVLISPKWIDRIDWAESIVYVNVVRDQIMQSPEYTDELLLNRDYETSLHQYYDQPGYWVDESETTDNKNLK